MGRLLVLFIAVPAVELALLIEIGSRVGTLATLGIIVATGVIGAALVRRQGFAVLRRIQEETLANRLPAEAMLDGVLVLVAGAFLLTPGILTDAVGFALLTPPLRAILKRATLERMGRAAAEGNLHVFVHTPGAAPREPEPPRVHHLPDRSDGS